MFHLIKFGVVSFVYPQIARELLGDVKAAFGRLCERPAEVDDTRVMVTGPRGPYYIEKKYLK